MNVGFSNIYAHVSSEIPLSTFITRDPIRLMMLKNMYENLLKFSFSITLLLVSI